MQQRNGRLVLSPSDLNNFLACEHRTALDVRRARGEVTLVRTPRPDAELIAERGRLHEEDYLAGLEADGLDVVRIEPGNDAAAAAEEAMRAGRAVIHQAAFAVANWRGSSAAIRPGSTSSSARRSGGRSARATSSPTPIACRPGSCRH